MTAFNFRAITGVYFSNAFIKTTPQDWYMPHSSCSLHFYHPSFLPFFLKRYMYDWGCSTDDWICDEIGDWGSTEAVLCTPQSITFIPNRTFLLRFGGISGEFGRAMIRILARRRWANIPMARPNEPDIPPKCTQKVWLGIYSTQIQPPTPLFQSECLSTCQHSWWASSRLVLVGTVN